MHPQLLVIGGSARAAVWSATPVFEKIAAIDRFGDLDLREFASVGVTASLRRKEVCRIMEEKGWLDGRSPLVVIPAGGMENQPTLWKWLQLNTQFAGTDWSHVRRVRDPKALGQALKDSNVRFPESRFSGEPLPKEGAWLLKSKNSGGGIQVSSWKRPEDSTFKLQLWTSSEYVQRQIDGSDYAATYVACQGRVELIGVTSQLCGLSEFGARGHWYCGSVGPIPIDAASTRTLMQLGQRLVGDFELEGVFGVDLRWDGDSWWLLEVNPRYPAGAEVLERNAERSVTQAYWNAREGLPVDWPTASTPGMIAKGIWFNQGESMGPIADFDFERVKSRGVPWKREIADIPASTGVIPHGFPVFSAFSEVSTVEDSIERLITTARIWETLIFATI